MQTDSRLGNGRFHALVLLLLLSVSVPARCDQHEMERSLRQQFEKRALILRHFYSDSKLRFDKEGNLLGHATPGYCTSDSMIYVAGLSIDKHSVLTLKGKRVLNIFDEKTGYFTNLVTKEPIQVVVELDSTWQDAAQVESLLEKIATTDIRQTANVVPKYWQCWLFGDVEKSKDGKWKCSIGKEAKIAESVVPSPESGETASQTHPRFS